MWTPHVLSKLVSHPDDGDIDEYHSLTQQRPGDHRLAEAIRRRPGVLEQPSIAFIQDAGDRLYIGMDGRVLDVLGQDHPAAYEILRTKKGPQKLRPILFVHGYFAPKDGDVSIPDLNELIAQQHRQLDEILRRANDEGAVQGKPIAVPPVTFSATRAVGTEWDKYAREFERGKHPEKIAIFTKDGKLSRWLTTQREPEFEKKSPAPVPEPVRPDNLLRMTVEAVTAVIVLYGTYKVIDGAFKMIKRWMR
jgi:hypothetical protein